MIATCRRCSATEVDPVYTGPDGWGDEFTLCPSCRSERNRRAAMTAGRIASGLADMYADAWGARSGNANVRKVEIRELPSTAVRSVFVIGAGDNPAGLEAQNVWRELGDGAYLVTMSVAGFRTHVAVQVTDGEVDLEPIHDDELASLPELAKALTAPGGRIQ